MSLELATPDVVECFEVAAMTGGFSACRSFVFRGAFFGCFSQDNQRGSSIAIARIDAFAGVWPAVGLTHIARRLIIRIAIVLGPFAFAFVGIIGHVVAAFGLAGVILGQGNW